MPASSLQSRIRAFEDLGHAKDGGRPSGGFKLDLNSDDAGDMPPSPMYSGPKTPSANAPQVSLIDLRDWVLEDEPTYQSSLLHSTQVEPPVTPASLSHTGRTETPLIVLDGAAASLSPSPKPAPPLPPRKPSYSSLKSVSTGSSNHTRHPNEPSLSIRTSDSLSPVTHAYPPLNAPRGHVQASSISSMHSVSLSDGGDEHTPTPPSTSMGMPREGDDDSFDDSFETLSTTSSAPPFDWPVGNVGFGPLRGSPMAAMRQMPPPPAKAIDIPGVVTHPALPYVPRRPPPIPPRIKPSAPSAPPSSRASVTSFSDRSSIFSVATATTSRTSTSGHDTSGKASPLNIPRLANPVASLMRPTPVPAAARARYEAVFAGNVGAQMRVEAEAARELSRNKARKTGWRGLSVDLVTNTDESDPLSAPVMPVIGAETTLSGHQVRAIWSASQVDRTKLRLIWRALFYRLFSSLLTADAGLSATLRERDG
jgi:hypothetical protein